MRRLWLKHSAALAPYSGLGLLEDLHIVMRTRDSQSSSDPMSLIGGHRTVLLHESLDILNIRPDDVVVDATLGGAGHARAIAGLLGSKGTLIGIDADPDALMRAEEALKDAVCRVILVEGNFRDMESHLGKHGIRHISKALFDLGWSGYQLVAGRGFSFLSDEPLRMTYGAEALLTAEVIVNTWSEETLAQVIAAWGEERFSRQIAQAIVRARKERPLRTSRELADIIVRAVPTFYRRGRLHPATRTFQALRIAVNDEMNALNDGLRAAWNHLQPNGRLAVISFHSVEDRAVKHLMQEFVESGGERLTKSPIPSSREEIRANPRSRSAKLRCIRKN